MIYDRTNFNSPTFCINPINSIDQKKILINNFKIQIQFLGIGKTFNFERKIWNLTFGNALVKISAN